MPQAACLQRGWDFSADFPTVYSLVTYLIGGSLLSGMAEINPGHHQDGGFVTGRGRVSLWLSVLLPQVFPHMASFLWTARAPGVLCNGVPSLSACHRIRDLLGSGWRLRSYQQTLLGPLDAALLIPEV